MENKEDDIIDVRARIQAANKPVMRVNRHELQSKGGSIAKRIPAFIAELKKANLAQDLSTTPKVADPASFSSSGFELGENEAKDQLHVEMDIFAGILEERMLQQQPIAHSRPQSGDDSNDAEFQLAMPPVGSIARKRSQRLMIRPPGLDVSFEDEDSADAMAPVIESDKDRHIKPLFSRGRKAEDDSETSSSDSDTDSSGSSRGRRQVVLEKSRSRASATTAGAAASVLRRASSASSATSSSRSSTSSEN